MEYQVARTCTCMDVYFSMFVKFPKLQIHFIDQEFIQTQVDGNRKMISGVGKDTVRMWGSLSLRMNAGTGVLNHLGSRTKIPSVGVERKHRHSSTRIVGNQGIASRLLEADVAGILTVRGISIQ